MSYKNTFLIIVILILLGLFSFPLYQLYKNRSTAKLIKDKNPTKAVPWIPYRDQNLRMEFQYPSDLRLSTGSDYVVLVRGDNKKYQIFIKKSDAAVTLEDYIQHTTQGAPTLEAPQTIKLGEYTWTTYAINFAGGNFLMIYELTLLPDNTNVIDVSALGTDFKPPSGASYKDTLAYKEFQKIAESFHSLR